MKEFIEVIKDIPISSSLIGWITGFVGVLTFTEWSFVLGAIVTLCSYIRESKFKKKLLSIEQEKLQILKSRQKKGKH